MTQVEATVLGSLVVLCVALFLTLVIVVPALINNQRKLSRRIDMAAAGQTENFARIEKAIDDQNTAFLDFKVEIVKDLERILAEAASGGPVSTELVERLIGKINTNTGIVSGITAQVDSTADLATNTDDDTVPAPEVPVIDDGGVGNPSPLTPVNGEPAPAPVEGSTEGGPQ